MKNKINVVYSSNKTIEEDSKLEENIKKTIGSKHEIIRYQNNNQFSLSQLYNKALKKYKSDDSIFVFIHNDIKFETSKWGLMLLTKFNNSDYQVIGVAGTDKLDDTGIWWNNKQNLYGIVNHTDGYKTWESRFSGNIKGVKECIVIDGVFMAINPDEIKGKCFDENYGKFHYYDIATCLKLYLDGFNIGVLTDIRLTHMSIGVTNKEWDENRLKFIEEYKDELPVNVIDYKLSDIVNENYEILLDNIKNEKFKVY